MTVVVTNIDDVEDLTHGFAIMVRHHRMEVARRRPPSVTFSRPTSRGLLVLLLWFCHAMQHGDAGGMWWSRRTSQSHDPRRPGLAVVLPGLSPQARGRRARRRSAHGVVAAAPGRALVRPAPIRPVTLDRALTLRGEPGAVLDGAANGVVIWVTAGRHRPRSRHPRSGSTAPRWTQVPRKGGARRRGQCPRRQPVRFICIQGRPGRDRRGNAITAGRAAPVRGRQWASGLNAPARWSRGNTITLGRDGIFPTFEEGRLPWQPDGEDPLRHPLHVYQRQRHRG